MRRFFQTLAVGLVVLSSVVGASSILTTPTAQAAGCGSDQDAGFLGLPYWWRGLGETKIDKTTGQETCAVVISADNNFQDIWTIVLNVVDILIRLIGLVCVAFIIYGGIRYIISQGNSGELATAKTTITRAVVGLVIAIVAVLLLNFVAGTILGLTVNKDTYKISGN